MSLLDMHPAHNSKTTQVSEYIPASADVIPVSDLDFFPEPPNYATIGVDNDAEVILYTGKDESINSLTGCLRGQSDTVAKYWDEGAQIYHSWTSELMNNIIGNVGSISQGSFPNLNTADGTLLKWDDENKQLVEAVEGEDYWGTSTLPVESGSWVAKFSGSVVAGNSTFAGTSGSYSRVGRLVHLGWYIDMSSKDSTMSGDIIIPNIPYTTSSLRNSGGLMYISGFNNPSNMEIVPTIGQFENRIVIRAKYQGGMAAYNCNNLGNRVICQGSIVYTTN